MTYSSITMYPVSSSDRSLCYRSEKSNVKLLMQELLQALLHCGSKHQNLADWGKTSLRLNEENYTIKDFKDC